jgi:hypothetical protein
VIISCEGMILKIVVYVQAMTFHMAFERTGRMDFAYVNVYRDLANYQVAPAGY